MRGFVRGVFWGGVSGIAGLAVVSQLAGSVALQAPIALQNTVGAAQPQSTAPDAGATAASGTAADARGAAQDEWDKIAPIPMPIPIPVTQPAKLPESAPQPAVPQPAAKAPNIPDPGSPLPPAGAGDARLQGPLGDAYVPPQAMAEADAKANVVPVVTPITPVVPATLPKKLPELAGAAEPAFAPAVEPAQRVAPDSPAQSKDALAAPVGAIAGSTAKASGNSLSDGVDLPESVTAAPQTAAQDKAVAPDAVPTAAAPLVASNDSATLAGPKVGDGAQVAPPSALASGVLLEQSETAGQVQVSQPVPLSAGGALQRYSRSFANLEQKPLFTILLVDDGAEGVDRAGLAGQDVPLTIVIDTSKPDALAHAKIWRAGGQEVVLSGAGLPAGVSGAAYGAALKTLADGLPEALALVDTDGRTFQNDLGLAAVIVPFLAKSGRGLVTLDQGANPADQNAKREGLPHGRIFRKLDVDGEAAEVVARYLDRAAFKAAQEGRVAVLGHVRPETVAGIMQWAVEGRAASVALAPVSALLAK